MKQGLGFRVQRSGLLVLLVALVGASVGAQEIQLGAARAAAQKGHVVLVSDAIAVQAGKPQFVELRFHVDQGFHINSHTPKDELLIPTVLKLDSVSGMNVVSEEYQKGSAFRLSVGAGGGQGEMLDVYQGDFRVNVRLVVPKGSSTLTGSLHYQACDSTACFPPKTLPVMVAVTGE